MSTTRMAEVVVSWGDALLDVQHVRPRRAPDEREPLDAPVVVVRVGRLCCLSPEGARRSLVARGAYRSPAGTEALRELDALSGGVLVLPDGESARVEVGALTYEVRPTAPAPGAPRAKGSRALRVALLGALVLHAPLFIALAFAPPRVAALTLDREPPRARLIALLPQMQRASAGCQCARLIPEPDVVPRPPRSTWEEETADPIEAAYFWATGGIPPHSHFGDAAWRDHHRSTCPTTYSLCALMRHDCASMVVEPAPDGIVRPGQSEVHGSLPRESVRRVVSRHGAELRFCYEQGLEGDPTLEGEVTLRWIVDADGHVVGSAIGSSDLRSERVEECMARAVRRWTFPSGRGMTAVSYPFALEAR